MTFSYFLICFPICSKVTDAKKDPSYAMLESYQSIEEKSKQDLLYVSEVNHTELLNLGGKKETEVSSKDIRHIKCYVHSIFEFVATYFPLTKL